MSRDKNLSQTFEVATMNLRVPAIGVIFCLGSSLLAADSKPEQPVKGDARAATLMADAAKSRYVWSPDVKSVSGKFAWEEGGKGGEGTFHADLSKRGAGVKVEGENLSEEVVDHVKSMIQHRIGGTPGMAARGTPSYVIVVEDEERGPLIMTLGDPMASTQRIKDGKMVQVNRLMGGKRFTIDVTECEKSPEGHYWPSAFTVTWWDAASGKKLEKQTYSTQGFALIDEQMFPKAEKVISEKDGKTTTMVLRYSDVKFGMGHQKAERK
jgi:hypothetical protein